MRLQVAMAVVGPLAHLERVGRLRTLRNGPGIGCESEPVVMPLQELRETRLENWQTDRRRGAATQMLVGVVGDDVETLRGGRGRWRRCRDVKARRSRSLAVMRPGPGGSCLTELTRRTSEIQMSFRCSCRRPGRAHEVCVLEWPTSGPACSIVHPPRAACRWAGPAGATVNVLGPHLHKADHVGAALFAEDVERERVAPGEQRPSHLQQLG